MASWRRLREIGDAARWTMRRTTLRLTAGAGAAGGTTAGALGGADGVITAGL